MGHLSAKVISQDCMGLPCFASLLLRALLVCRLDPAPHKVCWEWSEVGSWGIPSLFMTTYFTASQSSVATHLWLIESGSCFLLDQISGMFWHRNMLCIFYVKTLSLRYHRQLEETKSCLNQYEHLVSCHACWWRKDASLADTLISTPIARLFGLSRTFWCNLPASVISAQAGIIICASGMKTLWHFYFWEGERKAIGEVYSLDFPSAATTPLWFLIWSWLAKEGDGLPFCCLEAAEVSWW